MVTRRPVLHRKRFQTIVATVSLQTATSTPGDSARFTSVELSEKAMTTPATASAPNVLALTAHVRVGETAAVISATPATVRRSSPSRMLGYDAAPPRRGGPGHHDDSALLEKFAKTLEISPKPATRRAGDDRSQQPVHA